MKKRQKIHYSLLITYEILKTAYFIGLLPILVTKTFYQIIAKTINILIVYIYYLRYVFLIIFAVYLGYFTFNYYQSLPNPKNTSDFLTDGKISIYDRNRILLFDNQKLNQQLLEEKNIPQLDQNQLANNLVKKLKTKHLDFFQKQIAILRIKQNFNPQDLQRLYFQTSGYVIFNYQKLNVYKRSPVVVGLILKNLIDQYGQNLTKKDFTIDTSIDQVIQTTLQQNAIIKNQTNNLVIVYQPDNQEIIAIINQNSSATFNDLQKIITDNKLTLLVLNSQKQLANNLRYLFIN